MNNQQDSNAVRWYINEINTGQNSGMYFYTDEIEYGQLKYNKMVAAAEVLGGAEVIAAALARTIPADKGIELDEQSQYGWTPLWRIVQQYQICRYSDMPQYEEAFNCELPKWRDLQPWDDQELAEFGKADAWERFVAEMCLLNALLGAGSEHC